ncbi:MAG: hypothetical protein KF729_13570 [Sandaracinaceae bacterium]|nr:hypothetical protein [Sandaracinaceae bacterium]
MRSIATIGGCLLALALAACDAREEAALLEVAAVEPLRIEPDQRVRVRGSGFPAGREGVVRLEGQMHRPGAEPAEVQVELAARALGADRVEARFTRAALRAVGGRGTLHGRAVVSFDAAHGGARVVGRSAPLELDVAAGPAERGRGELSRRSAGRALIDRLGLELGEESSSTRGLAIAVVRRGSLAERAGLIEGDRLVSAEGVHVHDVADVLPAPGHDTLTLRLRRRGEAAPFDVALPIDAAHAHEIRHETVRALGIALGWLLLVLVLLAPSAGLADAIAGASRAAPRGPRTLRARWLRYRRGLPVVALGAALVAAVPAIDRAYPLTVRLEVLLLAGLALRVATGWLDAKEGARARLVALGGALAGATFVVVGLGAIATLGGTTDVAALSRQPAEPWSWTLVTSPVAVPALALVSLGAAWRIDRARTRLSVWVDDLALLVLAATTVAVLFGGWGTDAPQGPLRFARGAVFAASAFAYWLWLRRVRGPARAPRAVALAGLAGVALVGLGTIALVALEPPAPLVAVVARVGAGAAAILLVAAAVRRAAGPRPRPAPLHRFA